MESVYVFKHKYIAYVSDSIVTVKNRLNDIKDRTKYINR